MTNSEIPLPDRFHQIRPGGVRRYLLGRGWQLRDDARSGFVWFDGPSDVDGQPIDVVLPESEHMPDYARLLRTLVVALSHIEARPPEEIVENLIANDPSALAAG